MSLKRRLLIEFLCFTSVLGVAIGTRLHLLSVNADTVPPIATIAPIASFDVPVTTGERIASVRSDSSGLWFLLRSGTNLTEAVLVNGDGAVLKRQLLFAHDLDPIKDFCTGPGQDVAVLHQSGLIEIYSAAGKISHTAYLDSSTIGCTFADKSLIAAEPTHIFSLTNGQVSILSQQAQPAQWPAVVLALGNNKIGVIELGEAIVNQFDLKTAQWHQQHLAAPEIQGVSRPGRTNIEVQPAIFAVAADTSGDLYVAVNPYVVSQGAIVLRFGTDGSFKSRLRCRLPKSADLVRPKIPDGHFVVSYIALVGDRMVLVSRAQNKCISFVP
jgi:hypothetical protein